MGRFDYIILVEVYTPFRHVITLYTFIIDQSNSVISICDMKKMLGGEAKHIILRTLHRLQCKLIILYLSTEATCK
jgi:hypothetical protein